MYLPIKPHLSSNILRIQGSHLQTPTIHNFFLNSTQIKKNILSPLLPKFIIHIFSVVHLHPRPRLRVSHTSCAPLHLARGPACGAGVSARRLFIAAPANLRSNGGLERQIADEGLTSRPSPPAALRRPLRALAPRRGATDAPVCGNDYQAPRPAESFTRPICNARRLEKIVAA